MSADADHVVSRLGGLGVIAYLLPVPVPILRESHSTPSTAGWGARFRWSDDEDEPARERRVAPYTPSYSSTRIYRLVSKREDQASIYPLSVIQSQIDVAYSNYTVDVPSYVHRSILCEVYIVRYTGYNFGTQLFMNYGIQYTKYCHNSLVRGIYT